jgi:hypothetical protein
MPPRNYKKTFAEALKNNDEPTIRRLLEEGHVIYNQPLNLRDTFLPEYPLSAAAFYGSLAGINILLSYGAKINYKEYDTNDDDSVSEVYTPLMWAARSYDVSAEVILTLLECGGKYANCMAEERMRSETRQSMVEDILRYHLKDAPPILHYLLNNNLVRLSDIITIILEQFYRSPLPYFEALFSIIDNPNLIHEESGETLLFEFMRPPRNNEDLLSKRIETIKGLIALGINPNHKNKSGNIAADYAVSPKLAAATII